MLLGPNGPHVLSLLLYWRLTSACSSMSPYSVAEMATHELEKGTNLIEETVHISRIEDWKRGSLQSSDSRWEPGPELFEKLNAHGFGSLHFQGAVSHSPAHHEIRNHYSSTGRAHAEVLQHLVVQQGKHSSDTLARPPCSITAVNPMDQVRAKHMSKTSTCCLKSCKVLVAMSVFLV